MVSASMSASVRPRSTSAAISRAVAGAAAGVARLRHRGQEPHALLPGPGAVARVAVVAEVLDRDALLAGDLARRERLAHGVDEAEEHAG